jgi:hypothetical protein
MPNKPRGTKLGLWFPLEPPLPVFAVVRAGLPLAVSFTMKDAQRELEHTPSVMHNGRIERPRIVAGVLRLSNLSIKDQTKGDE